MSDSQPILRGTWGEILAHKDDIPSTMRVKVVPDPSPFERSNEGNLFNASPEEHARALDEIAALNKDIPPLPPEAFSRESMYEEPL